MLTLLRARWRNVLLGFWFLPGAVAAGFVALAIVLLAIDRAGGPNGVDFGFGGTGPAARSVLSTIAASLITVAGLAFSITIVTLQLVSGQFSPRATRTFLGDRTNQVAAGIFVGIFLYCVVVLRSVRDEAGGFSGFVPGLSVTGAILLAGVGLATLLVFIHHMAQSVKVANIAARIGRESLEAVDRLYPEPFGDPVADAADAVAAWRRELGEPTVVRASRPGYVQQLRLDDLAEQSGPGTRILVDVCPGDFVTETTALATIWPGRDGADEERLAACVRGAIAVDNERDIVEDLAFGLQQLNDVALRAISPGVNDPSSAVTCLAYTTAVVERLAGRAFPSPHRAYDGDVEIVARRRSFGAFVKEAFVDVGRYGAPDTRVVATMLKGLARVAEAARRAGAEDRLLVLLETAERAAGPALEEARTDEDRDDLEEHLAAVRRLAGEPARV